MQRVCNALGSGCGARGLVPRRFRLGGWATDWQVHESCVLEMGDERVFEETRIYAINGTCI